MTLLNFKYTTVQAPYVNILHLWLILFNYICCISITETASNINGYPLVTQNQRAHTALYIHDNGFLYIPFSLLY
jgi:hypothetical protein